MNLTIPHPFLLDPPLWGGREGLWGFFYSPFLAYLIFFSLICTCKSKL